MSRISSNTVSALSFFFNNLVFHIDMITGGGLSAEDLVDEDMTKEQRELWRRLCFEVCTKSRGR